MASMFSGAYDPGLKEWIEAKGDGRADGLRARDPVSGGDVQLGHTVFADDVQETNVTRDPDELYEVVADSGARFDGVLSRGGMARNHDKEEHVVHMAGRGAVARMRRVRAG